MPDPITHATLSYVFARHSFKNQKLLFVLAGLSPDIDVFIGGIFILLSGPRPESLTDFLNASMIFHPGLSAAIWFVPVYSLMLAWVFRKIVKKASETNFSRIYTLVLVGMLLHLGLDFLQSGNRPLWPLDVTAGLNILPYSPAGRFWTMTAAIGLLIFDVLVAYQRRQSRKSRNAR
jgi:membrane-bound metal-dependent hydrolase YbcI (DUF457 family)